MEQRQSAQDMTVAQLLAQVCRLTGHRVRSHMKEIGLHRGQGFALIHLLHRNGVCQRDLARALHISPAAATSMLQRMERDGWIERRRDETDQRLVRVFASEKGKHVRSEARRAFREIEEELNSIFTETEQATLKALLTKLYTHCAPGDPLPRHFWRPFEKQGEESE
jgi:DNA-binding MarR family transcriptional regulator